MSNNQKCEHGYIEACLMCGFGTIDGRRVWSDWAMTRQRAAYDRHMGKFIQIDTALKECAADEELTKMESLELLGSMLNRISKFEVGEEVVYIDPINSGGLLVITQVRKDGDYEVKTALRGWPVPSECWGFYPKECEIRKATKTEKLVKKRVFENAFIHKATRRMYTLIHVTNQTASKEGWVEHAVYKSNSGEIFSRPLSEFLEKFVNVNAEPLGGNESSSITFPKNIELRMPEVRIK